MFQETLNERTILALLKSYLNTYCIWRRLLLLAFGADFQVLLPVVVLSKLIQYIFLLLINIKKSHLAKSSV